jgi:nicotinate-nucleotide adenylyltransferase
LEIDRANAENGRVEQGNVSYTVDTLIQLKQNAPDAELFLLMGSDSLIDFHAWKEPNRICELATPLIARRPPAENVDYDLLADFMDQEKLNRVKDLAFQSLQIEISSTTIRNSVKEEKSIRFQTTRAVEEFIRSKQLYA